MANINNSICRSIANIDKLTREEWLVKRMEGIGGSDAGAVVGLNEYKSPIAVWQEKTGRKTETEDNDYLRIGRDLEDYVASRFEEETGKKVYRCKKMLQSVENPFMLADVDRLVYGEQSGLEIKTASPYKWKDWKNGDIPMHYQIQCNHYMAVTGLDKWYICALIYPHIEIREIERDEEIIRMLTQLEGEFWNNYVVENEMPPIDGSSATEDSLIQMYPIAHVNETVQLDSLESMCDRFFEIDKLIDKLEDEQAEIKHTICSKMGVAETAFIGGSKYKATWKTRKAREYPDTKKMKEDGIFEKYKKPAGNPIRYFMLRNEEE